MRITGPTSKSKEEVPEMVSEGGLGKSTPYQHEEHIINIITEHLCVRIYYLQCASPS